MEFEILEIARYFTPKEITTHNHFYSFDIFLYSKDYFKFTISDKHYFEVINGKFFKGDKVRIKSVKDDGILFELVKDDTYSFKSSEDIDEEIYNTYKIDLSQFSEIKDMDYKEKFKKIFSNITGNISYLPFLSDSPVFLKHKLPDIVVKNYKSEDFLKISTVANFGRTRNPIIGAVKFKSRVFVFDKLYKNPYYFFLVISSGYVNAKVFFWRQNAVNFHQSINIGDVIVVKNYRISKCRTSTNFIVLNTVAESLLIDGKEIQVQDNCEVYNCTEYDGSDGNLRVINGFSDAEEESGEEILSSQKTVNLKDTEYSKDICSKITGKIIFISVLMRKRLRDTSFLESKDKIIEFYNIKIYDGEKINYVHLYNNSSNEFNDLKIDDVIQINNIWKLERNSFIFYTSSAFTEISIKNKNVFIESSSNLVENALCFLPDNYTSLKDIENIGNVTNLNENFKNGIDIAKFFCPDFLTLTELLEKKENLVINETRKYSLKAQIISFDLSPFKEGLKNSSNDLHESSILIDSIVDGSDKFEKTGFIRVYDENDGSEAIFIVCYNRFSEENNISDIFKKLNVENEEELYKNLRKTVFIIVDGFRAGLDDVLLCVSKII